MKKGGVILAIMLVFAFNAKAQDVVNLWNGNPPTSNNITEPEEDKSKKKGDWVSKISQAELYIYKADKSENTGLGVVICPGGGYVGLAINNDGIKTAEWFASKGVTAIMLKYRMPNGHKEVPLDDAQEAIRYMRRNAEELDVNPNKIGIVGFSAGGHLASTASTHFTTTGISTRPDFSVLIFPVISMTEITHKVTRKELLGDNPLSVDIQRYSNDQQVNVNTPPAIIFYSNDDATVDPENGVIYYQALKKNGITASLHIFPEGKHGWAFDSSFKYYQALDNLLESWLDDIKNDKIK